MRRWWVVMAVVGVTAAVVGGGRALARLDTATLGGTWAGSWHNQTFGSTGDIQVVITPSGDSADFQWTITGNVFGCGPVGPTHGILLKGPGDCGGEACFTDHTVTVNGEDFTFGQVTIKGKKNGKFVGKGTNTCGGSGPKSYTGKAKLKGTTIAGGLKINTSSGPARTTFTATKQ